MNAVMSTAPGLAWRIERRLLLLATLLAAAATLPVLGLRSFWLDEVLSLQMAKDWSAMRADSNMWLYHILLHVWLRLGESEWTVRLLSALFAIAAVPLIGLLGRQLFGGWAGPCAAVLLALNLFMHRYAAEARAYSLLLLLILLSALCYLRLLRGSGWAAWLGFVLAAAAAVYAHFFAALVLLVMYGALLLQDRKLVPWRRFLLAALAVGLLLLPIPLLAPLGTNIDWLPRPHLRDLFDVLSRLSGGRWLLLFYATAVFFGMAALVRTYDRRTRQAWAFVALWLLFPLLTTFLLSFVLKPMFWPRYLIICLPALVLLAAFGLSRLPGPLAMSFAMTLLLLCSGPGLISSWRPDPGWREVASFVAARALPGDGAMVYRDFQAPPLLYYLQRGGVEWPKVERVRGSENLPAFADRHSRVWLLLRYGDRTHPGSTDEAQQLQELLQDRFASVEEQRFGPVRVLLYAQPRQHRASP
jgi:mannosyltransferase